MMLGASSHLLPALFILLLCFLCSDMDSIAYKKPKVIAEIGCNHKGDFALAKQMVSVAASFCDVDVVKFQKRNSRELLSAEAYVAPHPNPQNAYGDTYGAHREFLEFTIEQHQELATYCKELDVEYSTSVWDMTSARDIARLDINFVKIPSASNLMFTMLGYLCDHFHGKIHLSLGMTTRLEEEKIIKFFEDKARANDLILYACTSGYPITFDELCLLEISRITDAYKNIVSDIGFSGHHLGIAADIAALALGASWIERHFTLDRTWKGTDHAASLEPDGMRKLVRDLRNVHKALSTKPSDILEIERPQREKLKSVEKSISSA